MNRPNFLFLFASISGLLLFNPCRIKAQEDLLKVASSLKKSDGIITAYYPPSSEKAARNLQSLLGKAVNYYNKELGINFPISVVLFGPDEYARYTKAKFGTADPYNTFLPFVASGPPKVMCLPATGGSALDSLTQLALKDFPSIKKLNLSISEISQRFTAFVGLHELGHQYIRELEITQAVHWFQEMMANFIADAVLTDISPSDALIWQAVNEAYQSNLKPANRTFSGIHKGNQENYVWWQGNITLRAHDVYREQGFNFIQKLRKLSNVKIYHEDDLAFIIALEEIAPGFELWAEKFGHITVSDKQYMDSIRAKVRAETAAALADNMPNIYTSTYSNNWEKGNSVYRKTVMTFLKDFETNTFGRADLLAAYVELNFRGSAEYSQKTKIITKLKEIRAGFDSLKIRLQSVIPARSVDSNEDWVFVSGSMTIAKENNSFQNVDFFQQYRMNNEGKINLIKQFELPTN